MRRAAPVETQANGIGPDHFASAKAGRKTIASRICRSAGTIVTGLRPYLGSFILVLSALLIAIPIDSLLEIPAMSRVFLVAVLISAISYGLWPSIFAASISVLFYDFFFIPPVYSLAIHSAADLVNLAFFIVTAVVVSGLAVRVRRYAVRADRRALTAEKLSAFTRRISSAMAIEDVLAWSSEDAAAAIGLPVVTLLAEDGRLVPDSVSSSGSPRDGDVSERLQRVWSTRLGWPETFLLDNWYFQALRCDETLACLTGVRLAWGATTLAADQRHLLQAFAQQTASAIEQNRLRQRLADTRVQAEAEEFGAALLNSVSHDLRGPLTTILGATSALDLQWRSLKEDSKRELVRTARDETEHLSAYIGNLLDITRIAFGAVGPNLAPLVLADVVGVAAHKARVALSANRLTIDVPEDLPLVQADGLLLQQVIVNLLDNAAKYAPPGSQIVIAGRCHDDTVSLRILDEGAGLPENELERVFEKFFRSPVSRATQPGTGLGLAICRGLVSAMNGTIAALNRTDRSGLSVTVTLPVAPEQAVPRVGDYAESGQA